MSILGAGATARSALVSAAQLGAQEVLISARTPAKAAPLRALGDTLGVRVEVREWSADLPAADLLVSTVTAGAVDPMAGAAATSARVVFDVVYDPWPTALAAAADAAGRAVVNGLDLLVGQALLQLELMTGRQVDHEVLYAAGRAELATR